MHPNKLSDLARSLRPHMVILPWLIFTSVVVSFGKASLGILLLGLLWFISVYGIVVILNDISDYEIDKLNKRRTIPLVAGSVDKHDLLELMIGLSIVATACSLLLERNTLLLVVTYIALGWAYSGPLNVKSRGYLALILLAGCYAVLPWVVGFVVVNQVGSANYALAISASFVYALGFVALKDYKDKFGDTASGKATVLVRHGERHVQKLHKITMALGYGVAIIFLAITGHVTFTLIGVTLLLINLFLLLSHELSHRDFRRKYGLYSGFAFYGFLIASCVLFFDIKN